MRLLAGALALLLAGCSAPLPPGPYPTGFVPGTSASPNLDSLLLSPDGLDTAQRMTVRVRNVGCGAIVTGTGFAVDDHILVTTSQVIVGSKRIEVSTHDGQSFETVVLGSTSVADLAIIDIQDALPAYGELAAFDPSVSDAVTVVGYPRGGRLTTTGAVVTALDVEDMDPDIGSAFGLSATLESGMSGAPVVDSDGRVVGVVYGADEVSSRSFFLPVSTLFSLLGQPLVLLPESTEC